MSSITQKYSYPVPPKKRVYDEASMREIRSGIEEANRDIASATWNDMDAAERDAMRVAYITLARKYASLDAVYYKLCDELNSTAMRINRMREMYPGLNVKPDV